jgi:hypothetical protein
MPAEALTLIPPAKMENGPPATLALGAREIAHFLFMLAHLFLAFQLNELF